MEKSEDKETKKLAVTFYSKQKVRCPVCKKDFQKEEILSGGGRMIAGNLTDELRRNFEPSAKFGPVYPLMYSIGACPVCNVALYWSDFNNIVEDKALQTVLMDNEQRRVKAVEVIYPHYDFKRVRTLYDGAAAYYMALLTYEDFPADYSPTIKKAQICLRLAWLNGDLNQECPDRGFDFIQQTFYRKALFYYQEAMDKEMSHEESIAGIGNFGPDIDKNYGYDGVVYLNVLLEYKYGQMQDIPARLKTLEADKSHIARIFGLGKSSKSKPGPLLEHSRNLYENLKNTLAEANIIDLDDE